MSKELPAEPRQRKWVAIVTARRNEVWAWIAIGVTILLVAAVRLHRLDLPLERDEGEYAYGAQLILARSFSYATMHTMKLPGVHAAYALILTAFGETPAAIHAGLLLINAASIVLVFLIARRLFDPLTALAAGASFGMLSLGRPVFGLFAHAEHFAMLPALAGTLLLLGSRDAPGSSPARDFCSGIAFGVAAIMKQQATVLAGFGVTLLVITEVATAPRDLQRSIRRVLCFLLGTVLPYAGIAALFAGRFESFWLWTVQYPRDYVSATTLADGLRNLQAQANRMFRAELGLWSLAALGALALVAAHRSRAEAAIVALFFVFSFLATATGLYFREHYFVLVLPACALLIGVAVSTLARLGARWMPASVSAGIAMAICVASVAGAAFEQRDYLFLSPPDEVERALYDGNPFPESVEIGRYLREHAAPASTLAVVGSEPQILFYARRRSATGYVYVYPLMEAHERARAMQREMIQEIEARAPEFLVYVHVHPSWSPRPGAADLLLQWLQQYSAEHYEPVGVVEVHPDAPTVFRWEDAARARAPESPYHLVIFHRRADE